MSIRAARDREQEQPESEASEGGEQIQPAAGQPQFTSRGAIPPVQTQMGPQAGPSASDRAFGPAGVGAMAYARGSSLVAPGADRHVPHEAMHVVQQRQGRVAKPAVEDEGLEHEADEMGAKAQR
jgi:hypothetical protein